MGTPIKGSTFWILPGVWVSEFLTVQEPLLGVFVNVTPQLRFRVCASCLDGFRRLSYPIPPPECDPYTSGNSLHRIEDKNHNPEP